MIVRDVFTLLLAFQIKHFLADFPLQGTYMLGKFKTGTAWIKPLATHALVHAAFTFYVCGLYLWLSHSITGVHQLKIAGALALLDFVVHFTVDRIKASPHMLGKFKPGNKFFWWSLGADQTAHHLCHYTIIYLLLRQIGLA
jgi:hypothetical protein